MKLIALTRGLHEPVDLFPNAIVVPDSAITLPGRPLFVPDFAPCWEARIMVGVRVSRPVSYTHLTLPTICSV